MNFKASQAPTIKKQFRDALKAVIAKLKAGKKITPMDLIYCIDFSNYAQRGVSLFFDKSVTAVQKWEKTGCPRDPGGSFNLLSVVNWLIDREKEKAPSASNLDQKKKVAEIDYKEAQTMKIKGQFMDRDEHEKILCSMANSLRTYIEHSRPLNDHNFVGLTLDESRIRRHAEGVQMMNAFTGAMVEKETKKD